MRRGRIDVIASILTSASEGVGKTEIVYAARLNFNLAGKYLKLLLDEGFLNLINEERPIYRISEKGIEFLRNYKKLSKLAEKLLWRRR